jgi:uncharacterized membrane protein/cytoskeletal protein CcmA (bactofilin family)
MRAQRLFAMAGFTAGLLILVPACQQNESNDGDNDKKTIVLPAGEVHEGWYFAAGDRVIINGTVNGDAYVAGGTVEINGAVNGDLLAAGGTVRVGGKVAEDVRAAGGTVEITGEVGKNVTAAGGTVNIGRSGVVGGGVLAAGGTVEVSGAVKKDALLGGGVVEISGTIDGNVRIGSDRIGIYRGALIAGSLSVTSSSKEAVHIDNGTVNGAITIEERKVHEGPTILGLTPFRFWLKMIWIGGLLVTGLAFFLLSRKGFVEYATIVRHRTGMGLLWGLAGVIGVPIVCTILFATLIGLPLGLILLAVYCIVLYLSQLSLGLVAGNLIFKTDQKNGWIGFWAFAAGTVLFQALSLVPILGIFLEIAALLLGAGALLMMFRKAYAPEG